METHTFGFLLVSKNKKKTKKQMNKLIILIILRVYYIIDNIHGFQLYCFMLTIFGKSEKKHCINRVLLAVKFFSVNVEDEVCTSVQQKYKLSFKCPSCVKQSTYIMSN